MTQSQELHGWWKLISFQLEIQGASQRQQPFGANPVGRLVLSANGQMIALVTAEGRKAGHAQADQLALYGSMLAYTGRYRIEGDKFITNVESSWNEAWTGTDQERFYALKGDHLDIVSSWGSHPMLPDSPPVRGILSWHREL